MGTLVRKYGLSITISQPFEYALQALVYLAGRPGASASAQEIAQGIRVPAGYLQKILRILARAGMLSARRGTGGGFTLLAAPGEIRVLDVLRMIDTDYARIQVCPPGIDGHKVLCKLERMLDETIAQTERLFASTMIADLVEGEGGDEADREGPCMPTTRWAVTDPREPRQWRGGGGIARDGVARRAGVS